MRTPYNRLGKRSSPRTRWSCRAKMLWKVSESLMYTSTCYPDGAGRMRYGAASECLRNIADLAFAPGVSVAGPHEDGPRDGIPRSLRLPDSRSRRSRYDPVPEVRSPEKRWAAGRSGSREPSGPPEGGARRRRSGLPRFRRSGPPTAIRFTSICPRQGPSAFSRTSSSIMAEISLGGPSERLEFGAVGR